MVQALHVLRRSTKLSWIMGREIKILPLPVLWRHGRMEEKNRPWYPGECQLQTQIHPTLLPDAALQSTRHCVPSGVQGFTKMMTEPERWTETNSAPSWPVNKRTKQYTFSQTARIIRPRPDNSNDCIYQKIDCSRPDLNIFWCEF